MDYKHFFGFSNAPFHLTPDPAFYFPSDGHREALQTLLYSIRAGEGFVQITGDPGTGKTLLIRTILRELGEGYSTALIFNPRLSPQELIRTLLEDLGLDQAMIENLPREDLLRRFRDYLLDKAEHGERVLVLIDEAQNLPLDTLEELRLLSNLETEKEKLLQIILVGQRELEQRLDRPEVQQLYQRITIRYQLRYLHQDDIRAYIYHRIQVVTPEDSPPTVTFSSKALQAIYRHSQGTPRLINIICERSLMAAYVEGTRTITPEHVKKAMASIRGTEEDSEGIGRVRRRVAVAVAGVLVLAMALFGAWRIQPELFANPGLRQLKPILARIDAALPQDIGFWGTPKKEPAASAPAAHPAPTHPPDPPQEHARAQTPRAAVNATPAEDKHRAENSSPAPTAQTISPDPNRPPAAAVEVAQGAYFGRVLVDAGRVQIWRGTSEGPELVKTLSHDWPHGRGLYVVGHDPQRGGYVFNHAAFLRGNPTMQASSFFDRLEPFVRGNALPLLAGRLDKAGREKVLRRARNVRSLVQRFTAYWENQRIDALFGLYGSLIINHYADQPKPIVLSKEQSYERKQEVFRRNQSIELGVSRPLYLINPADTDNVLAVYHQRYRSQTWDDDGTKALYFNYRGQGQDPAWTITAELWVPDMGEEGEE